MNEEISPVAIEDKMKDAYLSYSLSVIVGRALPDVRDGLKPVHRRILYAAYGLGLTHNKPHKKSARIVGEVLGKYHPHGDAAVYNAMVRMAQDFNQRYRLIDGHGNFGSIDGDSPAAMRYTEARLTAFARELLSDIKKQTVGFVDNFDGSLQEPVVLPSRIPNLLVNGASGIAVGMSTNIPPHNLSEVIDALKYLLKHPGAAIETLVNNYIKGPDFPTGATILGNKGILKAYKTGKGKVTMRAKTTIEKKGRKKQLVVTEIPYQVNKAKLIEEIAELVNKGKLEHISDVRDETDKEGLRVVLELKQGTETDLLLNRLYKYTSLQTNFRINLLALVENQPRVMNIKTILQHFLDFRRQVITRRTRYQLEKAENRYQIVQGLIKAISRLDLVIKIIRNSQSTEEALTNLIEQLEITDRQARAILEMKLQRLVAMEVKKLKEEAGQLQTKITELKEILNNRVRLDQVLREELQEIKEEFGDNRQTEIIEDEQKAVISKKDLIKEKPAVVSRSYRNHIKRSQDREQLRSGKNDYILETAAGSSYDSLLFFTDTGDVYTLPIHKITEHHGLSTGDKLKQYLNIPLGEKIIRMLCLKDEFKDREIVMATARGRVKKSPGREYETRYTSIKAIKLADEDRVVDVFILTEDEQLLLGSKQGRAIRFKADSINTTGRNTMGSKGIKLAKGDCLINMNTVKPGEHVISLSRNGKGNRINGNMFKPQNRNGRGVRTVRSDNYTLQALFTARPEDQLLVVTGEEKLETLRVEDIPETNRPGYMYNLFNDEKEREITAAYKLPNLD